MRTILPAVAGAALCALAACTDLPPLGECGNGVIEYSRGEDCDEPDPSVCLGCRLVCNTDVEPGGACPSGERCCPDGQRCGVDNLCRTPSGVFASPSAIIPFNATAVSVADVDGDGIGDAFGINRQQASFLFGTTDGALTRSGSAPIPTLSRPESQVTFLDLVVNPASPVVSEIGAGVVLPTSRGFAVVVSAGGRLVSPPLPELEFDADAGKHLAAAPSETGEIIAVVDANDRLMVRAFADRIVVANDPTPCNDTFTTGPGIVSVAQLAIARAPLLEHTVVALTQAREQPPTLEAAVLCMYPAPPGSAPPLVLPVPAGTYVPAIRVTQLDADACPEVVAEVDDAMQPYVIYFDTDYDAGSGRCIAAGSGTVADGRLLGAGDLVGDARDEVIVGRAAYTTILAGSTQIAALLLPEALDTAVVADVNRDGASDIVAIGPSPDLTVVLAVPAGFAPRTIATTGNLRELVTGDFDADTFPDVASAERLPDGTARVVVGFGGPFGPQGLDPIGTFPSPRSLTAYLDRSPAAAADAFADLFVVHTTYIGGDEASQFDGSGTRALTSQLDLSGPPPGGDGGQAFGRTTVSGELMPPGGDGTDFCTLSLVNEYPAVDPPFTTMLAFCVGGQGAAISYGALADLGELSAGLDLIDPGETMPLVVGARVGRTPAGEPIPVVAAVRRDVVYAMPRLIVMPMPTAPGVPPAIEPQVIELLAFPDPPVGYARQIYVVSLRAVQLDADTDSELVVTVFEFLYNPLDIADSTFSTKVHRVDLEAPANVIGAPLASELIDQSARGCIDAALVDLGGVVPDGSGVASEPGPEIVVLCADDGDTVHLYALYRTAAGLVGPFDVGLPEAAFGALAVGDVTGDRLDDIVILSGLDGDTSIGVMAQCPAHDTSACATKQDQTEGP